MNGLATGLASVLACALACIARVIFLVRADDIFYLPIPSHRCHSAVIKILQQEIKIKVKYDSHP